MKLWVLTLAILQTSLNTALGRFIKIPEYAGYPQCYSQGGSYQPPYSQYHSRVDFIFIPVFFQHNFHVECRAPLQAWQPQKWQRKLSIGQPAPSYCRSPFCLSLL
ncbi:hypothetical protein BDW71DRAFT_183089 [Aspergillus fruticulosus]